MTALAHQRCFNHALREAAARCPGCGNFFCRECVTEHDDRVLCAACLETGKTKGKIKSLDQQRTLYDSIALALAIFPLIIFYFTIITAPMTLYVAIRHWNAPPSLLRRSKIRFIIAIILALLQIGGWTALLVTVLMSH